MFSKYFSPCALVATIGVVVTSVDGVDIQGFTSTVSCTDFVVACANIPSGLCCGPFPEGYGFSVRVTELSNGSVARIFGEENCIAQITDLPGPGDVCWNGRGLERGLSAHWLAEEAPETGPDAASITKCVEPNVFGFTNDKGENVRIEAPEGQASTVAELVRKHDFKALAKYPKVGD